MRVCLSAGLSVETVMIQWGHWRAVCRWGWGVCKRRSHMFCFPGSRGGRDKSGGCIWDAAPGRHTDELMKCYAVRLVGGGAWRVRGEGIPAINHTGWSWNLLLPDQPGRREEHGAKATLKALSVPPQHESMALESKEKGWGDNNQEVWCHVTREV